MFPLVASRRVHVLSAAAAEGGILYQGYLLWLYCGEIPRTVFTLRSIGILGNNNANAYCVRIDRLYLTGASSELTLVVSLTLSHLP